MAGLFNATPRSLTLVPDPKRTGTPPRCGPCPSPRQTNPFASGQTLQEGRLFGLDLVETGIKLCHPPARGYSFGGAPSLFDFQACDSHVRSVGDKEAVHSTSQRTNGP